MSDFPFEIKKLQKSHIRDNFNCEEESLNRYLKKQAGQDFKKKIAAPYVLLPKNDNHIIGYYTLTAFSLETENWPDKFSKKVPYQTVPATLLGRLAIDKKYKGQKLGEYMLLDALNNSYQQSTQIASFAVIVDALNENAAKFYNRYGFINFPSNPLRLFIPMKDIAGLF